MRIETLAFALGAVVIGGTVGDLRAASTIDSTTWEGQYDADVLPDDDGWTDAGLVSFFTDLPGDSTLRLNNLTANQAATLGWWQISPGFDFSTGVSVEFRVKVNDPASHPDGMFFNLEDVGGNNFVRFRLFGGDFGTDQVQIAGGIGGDYQSATAVVAAFQIYRITVATGTDNVKLYVNGATVPAAMTTLTNFGSAGTGQLAFGDASTNPITVADWSIDWVRWTTEGVFDNGAALSGDLDSDGFVGIADLNIVLGNWNQNVPPGDPLADPSGDSFVGIEDLNTVLGNWNAGTPPPAEASNTVPEPSTLVMTGLLAVILSRRIVGRD
jgi:hypothetical protein